MQPVKESNKFRNFSLGFIAIILLAILILNIVIVTNQSSQKFDSQYKKYTFKDIERELVSGNKLRILIDFSKMFYYVDGTKTIGPDAKTAFDIDIYEYFGPRAAGNNPTAYIAASHAVLIKHPSRGVIYNYGKVRLFSEDAAEVTIIYLKADTFETTYTQVYNCTLVDDDAIYFTSQTPQRYEL